MSSLPGLPKQVESLLYTFPNDQHFCLNTHHTTKYDDLDFPRLWAPKGQGSCLSPSPLGLKFFALYLALSNSLK